MSSPESPSSSPVEAIIPSGMYTRYDSITSSGSLFKCISFDPDIAATLHNIAERDMHFAIPLDTAIREVIGEPMLRGVITSPYVRALDMIKDDVAAEKIGQESYAEAIEGILQGTIEQTALNDYVERARQASATEPQ